MNATARAILSAAVAFTFYFGWTWWVNSLASDDEMLVLRSAFVQGGYSALMTLIFTSMLNWTLDRLKCHKRPYIAVLPPLVFQATMVIAINAINATPNLIGTVAPSIFFTGLYGAFYAKSLLKSPAYICKHKLDGYEKYEKEQSDRKE